MTKEKYNRCWFFLREDQCCERKDCKYPQHIGDLCGYHFAAAPGFEKAWALMVHKLRGGKK